MKKPNKTQAKISKTYPATTVTKTKTVSLENEIFEVENLDRFGVLLFKTEWLEEVQNLSGQDGAFTKEWQFHYWFASARKTIDGQTLDIAIPLCFFNYPQEVSGAHIDFELPEVQEASEKSYDYALKKFEEFSKTTLYNVICEITGTTNWNMYGLSNVHAHPSGINSFSSTDLNKSTTNPGVVYPYNKGTFVPHFAGIMQHKNGKVELVRNEFRVFTAIDNANIYEKGRCLTICPGFTEEWEEPEKKVETEIDHLFGTKRFQPKPKDKPKDRKDMMLRDGLSGEEGVELAKALLGVFKECDYEPDYNLDAALIKPKVTTYYPYNKKSNYGSYGNYYDDVWDDNYYYNGTETVKKGKKKTGSLFADDKTYATHRNKKKDPVKNDVKETLRKVGYSEEFLRETSWNTQLIELKEIEFELEHGAAGIIRPELIEFMHDIGYEYEEIVDRETWELEEDVRIAMKTLNLEDLDEFDEEILENIEKSFLNRVIEAKEYLIENQILSEIDFEGMTDFEILSAYMKMRGEDDEFEGQAAAE